MERFYKLLGQKIAENRQKSGLSRRALAAKLGITYQQLYKYEMGENRLAAHYLVTLSSLLGCSASELLGEKEKSVSRRLVAEITFREI